MKRLAIVGSAIGGGAAQIIDALSGDSSYSEIMIFDRDAAAIGTSVMGAPVVDSSDNVLQWHRNGRFDSAVIGVGMPSQRAEIFASLSEAGVNFVNVIDPTANIRPTASLGLGNVILANAYIGPYVTLGDNNYVITNTFINHHSRVGSSCYFSTGCKLAGRVLVGDRVRFDTASGAKGDVKVPDNASVAAGTILTQ
jgi:UDP-perosamine 4-acetyltransferase